MTATTSRPRGRLVARFDYDRGSVLCALAGPDRPDRSMDRSDRSADRTGLPLSVALSGLSGLWTGHDSSLRPSLMPKSRNSRGVRRNLKSTPRIRTRYVELATAEPGLPFQYFAQRVVASTTGGRLIGTVGAPLLFVRRRLH